MDGVFVTGTGTEVGKTVAAGVIARCAADAGHRVSVFKPAVSGLDEAATDGLVPDYEHLRMAARSEQSDDEIAPYRFGPAVSPHHAAALKGSEIDAERLRAGAAAALDEGDFCVCEGVGGFLVPLRLDYLVRDFAVELGLPVVIVASPGLGTINHTLLTVEAVRGAGLDITAVVLTPWRAEPTEMEESNLEAIEVQGATAVHTLRQLDPGDPATWPALAL